MKKIFQYWVGKDLPLVHVKLNKNIKKVVADLIIHPIKRRLAKYYCLFLQKYFGLVVIGITGSAGKTSTKEMIASILRLSGKTVWTKENIDPIFNIPQTILKCSPKTKYLILEMGVEYPYEMDFYLWLVKPNIGIITNIYPTHTLYFGDVNGVFNEKIKLVKSTKFAILNRDDEMLYSLKNKIKANICWFKSNIDLNEQNKNAARICSQVLGIEENIVNKGLENFKNLNHRMTVVRHKSGAVIFDDSYNSNPEAFKKSFQYFIKLAGNNKRVAVVGDMLELGEIEREEHEKISKMINKYDFIDVIGVGKLARLITKNVYENSLDALPAVKKYLKDGYYIFIKGSHSIGLDKIVERL